jgi:hypothetical protein
MVTRKATRSRVHEPMQGSGSQPESARAVWLVYSRKPTPSLDDVSTESRGAWRGRCTESAGFAVVHYKTVGFLGCSTKPRLKARRAEMGSGRVEKVRGGEHAA